MSEQYMEDINNKPTPSPFNRTPDSMDQTPPIFLSNEQPQQFTEDIKDNDMGMKGKDLEDTPVVEDTPNVEDTSSVEDKPEMTDTLNAPNKPDVEDTSAVLDKSNVKAKPVVEDKNENQGLDSMIDELMGIKESKKDVESLSTEGVLGQDDMNKDLDKLKNDIEESGNSSVNTLSKDLDDLKITVKRNSERLNNIEFMMEIVSNMNKKKNRTKRKAK